MSQSSKNKPISQHEGVRRFLVEKTPLGFIYQKFFKRFTIVQSLVIWTWKRSFPTIMLLLVKLTKIALSFPIVGLASIARERVELAAEEKVLTPVPEVYPKRLAIRCPSPHEAYIFPAIYRTEISNFRIRGASNFLIGHDYIVHHDLFRAKYDYTSEELNGRMLISVRKKLACIFSFSNSDEMPVDTIEEAAVFTDAVSQNYAHFMTEILPRIQMFVSGMQSDMPLVIDAGLHTNLMAAIRLIVGKDRQLIELATGQEILVKNLWVMSVCGYVPFERRPGTESLAGHSQGVFSPVALLSMRDALRSSLQLSTEAQSTVAGGRKIFIRRNSGYRNVVNSQDIENALVARGFEVVEPEKLTFAEQVALFSSAAVVVGATGAAFANLIFCNPKTRIIIMIARMVNTSYYYWQNIACACGNRVTYVLGEGKDAALRSIHSDFCVSVEDVLSAIDAPEDIENTAISRAITR
ncbi:MAG TPA: glycosyltransferase family 61 protein [Nitrosomonas sp.]|nr:glycosyltransferase family 61 protein [Nitrosomonas sp.]